MLLICTKCIIGDKCSCAQQQMTSHIVKSCPLTTSAYYGLLQLHPTDDNWGHATQHNSGQKFANNIVSDSMVHPQTDWDRFRNISNLDLWPI